MYQGNPNGCANGPQPLPEQLSDTLEAERDEQITVVEGEDSEGTPLDDQAVSMDVRSDKAGFLKDTETEGIAFIRILRSCLR